MKKILCIKNIKWLVGFLIVVIYIGLYAYQYRHAVKPDIRYYDKGTKVENAGIEYEIEAKLYSPEEFMETFDVEAYEISCIHYDYDVKMIVIEKKMTRVSDTIDIELNRDMDMKMYCKYWQSGLDMELTDLIQKEDCMELSDLKVGESTSQYQVYIIASCNLCERLWNRAEKEKVYFEFADNEKYNYVRRIKILN